MQVSIATNILLLLCVCYKAVITAGLPCDPPCKHGECTAYLGELSCRCSGNWSGALCDIFVCDEANPCLNNGLCAMHPSNSTHYTCSCPLGYTGDRCQYTVPKGETNNNTDNPCGARGVYYLSEESASGYYCDCIEGHFGETCTHTTNPCATEDCSGHGHCNVVTDVKGNAYSLCTCDEDYGFAALRPFQCHILKRYNHCRYANPCQNGAECKLVALPGDYSCTCPPNFQGRHCELPFDVCSDQNRCLNGGHCIPNGHYFTCSCPPNFTGEKCEILMDPCFGKTCLNEGYCIKEESRDLINGTASVSARCECPCGYSGQHCEIAPLNRVERSDPCTPNPCDKDGVCSHKSTAPWFTCQCKPGRTGSLCETVDYCSKLPQKYPSSHCKECVNTKDSFHCVCESGWGGKWCDQDIDECFSKPCGKGQQCTNEKGTYSCT